MNNCPHCNYPDAAYGQAFKGVYTPGEACPVCGYTEKGPLTFDVTVRVTLDAVERPRPMFKHPDAAKVVETAMKQLYAHGYDDPVVTFDYEVLK